MGVQFYKKQEKLLIGPLEEDFLTLMKEYMYH